MVAANYLRRATQCLSKKLDYNLRFFPGPSKATRAYLHRESEIVKALQANGWQVQRNAMTKTRFYFSRLLEATR